MMELPLSLIPPRAPVCRTRVVPEVKFARDCTVADAACAVDHLPTPPNTPTPPTTTVDPAVAVQDVPNDAAVAPQDPSEADDVIEVAMHDEEKPLDACTLKELRERCLELGLSVHGKKADLISRLGATCET